MPVCLAFLNLNLNLAQIPQHPSIKRKIVESILNRYKEGKPLNLDNSESDIPSKMTDQMEPIEDDLSPMVEKSRTASLQVDEGMPHLW